VPNFALAVEGAATMPSGSAESKVRPAGHSSKDGAASLSALGRGLRLWGPTVALILLCIGFSLADPGFATIKNLQTVADRGAIPLIVATGMTFIILQGSIDLSIEGVMASSSLTFAMTVLNSRTGLDLGIVGILMEAYPAVPGSSTCSDSTGLIW
jgi:ribose/xylose/arabinose/galactoside ABC-type transport system permease subunit